MGFDSFDVVVVPFPFTDKAGTKRRPALVISSPQFNGQHDQVVLAMITTAKQSDWPSDVAIHEWGKAGLSVPCRIRFKLFTLEKGLILKRVGALGGSDRMMVQEALARTLAVG